MSKRLTTEQRLTPERLEAIRERLRVAIRDKWRTDYASFTHMAKTIEDIPALLAEVERLRKALEFYANESNNVYFADYPGSYLTESAVMEDNGNIAREVLRND